MGLWDEIGGAPSTTTCIQQAINKCPLTSQKMQKVLRFACPAVDLDPSKDFSFQMLRKMSNEPSEPTLQGSGAQGLERDVQGPEDQLPPASQDCGPRPCPQGFLIPPKGPGAPLSPSPEDLELSLHPGPASPPLGVFRQLVITKSIFLSLTISIFLILT